MVFAVTGRTIWGTPSGTVAAAALLIAGGSAPAWAADGAADPAPLPQQASSEASDQAPQAWAVHAQTTFTAQAVDDFRSPYTGANSLIPGQARETWDVTLFAGVKPWRGGEIWVNPEIDQGFGLSNTLGVAGFLSGEAYKVGKSSPYLRLQRLFLRQTIDLGGTKSAVAGAANQLAGTRTDNRLVLTLGKFGVADVFDTNGLAHDPRGDFFNWSLVDTGSFDYAADAWGYSYGAAAEWYQGTWTLRAGLFNLSKVPNGEVLERDFTQNQIDVEIEHRHSIGGHPGAIRVLGFRNRGRFGHFDEALARVSGSATPPDTADVRRRMSRLGVSVNGEQEVTEALGLFVRAGWSDGAIETYDFTDIDRTVALGGSLKGSVWGREPDRVGLAVVVNGISAAHRAYLAAGGVGVLVGDGRLPHAGDEQILETYYAWRPLGPALTLTFDYQHVVNPAYNRDRGPANAFALRLHGEF